MQMHASSTVQLQGSLSSSLSSAAFGTIYLGISPNDAPAKISFVQITSLKFRSATAEIIGDQQNDPRCELPQKGLLSNWCAEMLCLSMVLQERTYFYLDHKEGAVKLIWFILCCLWVVNRKCGGILGHHWKNKSKKHVGFGSKFYCCMLGFQHRTKQCTTHICICRQYPHLFAFTFGAKIMSTFRPVSMESFV